MFYINILQFSVNFSDPYSEQTLIQLCRQNELFVLVFTQNLNSQVLEYIQYSYLIFFYWKNFDWKHQILSIACIFAVSFRKVAITMHFMILFE